MFAGAYDLGAMYANASYSLVPLPPEQGALVPVSTSLVADSVLQDDGQFNPLAFLWHCCCQLALLFWLAVLAIRELQRQLVELRRQANFWRAQHQRAVAREAILATRVRHLQAEIRELKRRLFARKSETASAAEPKKATPPGKNKARSRGQQPGSKGHGRRNYDHVPTSHEDCVLPEAQKCCPACGESYEEIPGTADGDILETEVRAHRRRYHRKRYRRCCDCAHQPALLTAPPPDKLIPKSNLGISVWTLILERKFEFFQPLYRVLAELRSHDLHLAAGTITDGLQKLVPLFEPLYELLVERNRAADHWHCDETRWLVFEKPADKANFIWMLWVFATKESIVFVLDPTRAHDVPEGHFGDDAEGIASVDRYSAYKAMAQVKAGKIMLAFCWAHVRRDFLAVLTGWSELTDWAWSWVEDIGLLYHRNNQRVAVQEDARKFAEADQLVRAQIEHMRQRCETELAEPNLRQPQRKVLTSLQGHWSGLTVFVDHPEVPMDNNTAERCHRGPVVARKNFYGSGALWSGRLAAMLFSLFQTTKLWGLVAGKWLNAYLTACAQAGGKPPPDPQRYLPWNMTADERQRLGPAKPNPTSDTPNETAA
jgi:transposase